MKEDYADQSTKLEFQSQRYFLDQEATAKNISEFEIFYVLLKIRKKRLGWKRFHYCGNVVLMQIYKCKKYLEIYK